MNKTKVIGLMLLLALFVPTVSACHWEPPVVEEPEPEPYDPWSTKPTLHLSTDIKNSHLTKVWNGKMYIPNPNFTVEIIGNRMIVTYLPYPTVGQI